MTSNPVPSGQNLSGRAQEFQRLMTEAKDNDETRSRNPRSLPLTGLHVETAVFQHREYDSDVEWQITSHVADLVMAIKREPNHRLDPIVVWKCGGRWIVLDGHFRLKAYMQYAAEKRESPKTFKVPCKVFDGTLTQAWDFSVQANKKVVAPLTSTERSNAMWRRVCMSWQDGEWSDSKADMERLGLVASNTISRMRRSLKELIGPQGVIREDAMDMTWLEVITQDRDFDLEDFTEEERDEWVERWANQLRRTFGKYPPNNADLFAEAIERYSPTLIEGLTEYLAVDPDEEPDF